MFQMRILVQMIVHQSTWGYERKTLHILYAHSLKVVLHDLIDEEYIELINKKRFIVKVLQNRQGSLP